MVKPPQKYSSATLEVTPAPLSIAEMDVLSTGGIGTAEQT